MGAYWHRPLNGLGDNRESLGAQPAFRARLPELRDLPDPDQCQPFRLPGTFSDAVGRRSRADVCSGCACRPRTYPRGLDARLRPGRPRPLDQARLPTLNLALSQRRFGPDPPFHPTLRLLFA